MRAMHNKLKKPIKPLVYHHNGFGDIIHSYILLILLIERMLSKLSKDC